VTDFLSALLYVSFWAAVVVCIPTGLVFIVAGLLGAKHGS
jgi:hypothetical protein